MFLTSHKKMDSTLVKPIRSAGNWLRCQDGAMCKTLIRRGVNQIMARMHVMNIAQLKSRNTSVK